MVYAIHKLALSYSLESVSWWSVHPSYGQVFEQYSARHRDHVGTAFAINAAFAAVEELQLEVKSSAQKKRFLQRSPVEWNQDVLEDLGQRLKQAGIDPAEKIEWVVRGNPAPSGPSFFLNTRGRRFAVPTLEWAMHNLGHRTGLRSPGKKGPGFHDLRHTFAVHRLVAWYRAGADVQAKLPLLATYMGHVGYQSTAYYLTATAELLGLAEERRRRFLEESGCAHE